MKGWAELLLCTAVLAAAWVRTPVGAIARNGVAWVRDQPTEDVLASFRTDVPERLERSIAAVAATPDLVAPDPALDQGGWSPALRTAVGAHLGEDAVATLVALDPEDPAAALELHAIGPEARARAIRRARAAGEAEPERLSAHARYLSKADARRADEEVIQVLSLATALDLAWPVDPSARVSSRFGYRTHPTLGTKKLHEGVDIAIPIGTPVHAAGSGRVTRAREDRVNGKHVIIDHGHRVRSAYCHGDALHVSRGQAVGRGEHVMDSGNTGRSTGPHLHFGLRIGGRPIDPAPFQAIAAKAHGAPAPTTAAPDAPPTPEAVPAPAAATPEAVAPPAAVAAPEPPAPESAPPEATPAAVIARPTGAPATPVEPTGPDPVDPRIEVSPAAPGPAAPDPAG
jgi:murein DD-endopeptidase MepM/ murein hydrolase activator NlpD